ncbi:hypothetical protein JHK87_006560 [Glycine soja]|nr:hypothetical protein JHK87_006560 [Glycine soja]
MVVLMVVKEFPALVEKAKTVECLEGDSRVIITHGDGSSNNRRGNIQKKPYSRPQQPQGN